jgi:hypothetical protein
VVIDDLLDDFESGAFEKLFPGPIISIDRGINGMFMTVVLTRARYIFDENMGKIFIEVLNALIHDRKVEKKFDKVCIHSLIKNSINLSYNNRNFYYFIAYI